jgi:hypothetical protein
MDREPRRLRRFQDIGHHQPLIGKEIRKAEEFLYRFAEGIFYNGIFSGIFHSRHHTPV